MIETGSIRKMGAVSYSPSLVTFVPRISPQLNRLRPKFCEHCRPLTSACVPTLLRFGWGDLNTWGRGRSRSLKMAPFDRLFAIFYWWAIVSTAVCCTIFKLFDVE